MNKLEDAIINEFMDRKLSKRYVAAYSKSEKVRKRLEKGFDENQKCLLRDYDDLCSELNMIEQEELVKFCLDFLRMF